MVLEFPNGVRVSFNTTTIVEREVFFEARSPGGLGAVADADVPDAAALGAVIGDSGVGDFDRVALDAFLDDKSVSLSHRRSTRSPTACPGTRQPTISRSCSSSSTSS